MEYLVEYRISKFQDCQMAKFSNKATFLAFVKKLKELNANLILVSKVCKDLELMDEVNNL